MVKINIEKTRAFASKCSEGSEASLETIARMERLYKLMSLDLSPSPWVDFTSANTEADDLGDIGYIADALVLDAEGADEFDVPDKYIDEEYRDQDLGPLDLDEKTDAAISTAGNLQDGGDDGRDIRDRRNAQVTVLALEAAIRAGADINVTDDGLIVAVRENGIPLDFGELGEKLNLPDDIPISARGGTTFGNVFIAPSTKGVTLDAHDRPVDQKTIDLLEHETVHTYQWAAAGIEYAALYLWESRHDPEFSVGSKKIDLPGPWDIEIPWPDVDMEPDDVGCDNRYEDDADLEKGGYSCDP